MKNYFRFSVFIPCDPNQTDRIIRYIATQPGNHFVGMGRSKTPTITKEDGSAFYDADYVVIPGRRIGCAGVLMPPLSPTVR